MHPDCCLVPLHNSSHFGQVETKNIKYGVCHFNGKIHSQPLALTI